VLRGGYNSWVSLGYPVTTAPAPAGGQVQPGGAIQIITQPAPAPAP
jgi:hypothetical protein